MKLVLTGISDLGFQISDFQKRTIGAGSSAILSARTELSGDWKERGCPVNVPEGPRKLAGGRASAASDYHRITVVKKHPPRRGRRKAREHVWRVDIFQRSLRGASFLCRRSGGVRCARPPANFRCPSGTRPDLRDTIQMTIQGSPEKCMTSTSRRLPALGERVSLGR